MRRRSMVRLERRTAGKQRGSLRFHTASVLQRSTMRRGVSQVSLGEPSWFDYIVIPETPILIREIAAGDAEAAAELSAELGYPTAVVQMRRRIEQVSCTRDRVVYVACMWNVVVGWIDVGLAHHLSTGAFGEIAGLVVSGKYRSSGIGRQLVMKAEEWVANHGVQRIVVRSRTTRESAHRFYLREGYSLMKTSAVFSKELTTTGLVRK